MPSIRNPETVDLIAQNYCTNNYNKTRAMVDAGYSAKYADTGQAHRIVFGNVRVKAAIAEKIAEISKKIDVTVEFIVEKLLTGLQLAEQKQDLVAIARFSELLGRYKAMFTDKYQDDSGQQRELSELEKAEARRIAGIRLKEMPMARAGA